MSPRPLCLLLALGCDPSSEAPPPVEAHSAPVVAASAAPGASVTAPVAAHLYAAKDFRRDACAAIEPSGAIDGTACKSGFVVFGPYANVPAGATVDASFDVEALADLNVYVELVSAMGTKLYAALPEQPVQKSARRNLALRTRAQSAIEGLELRVVMSSAAPIDFKIRDLKLQVH